MMTKEEFYNDDVCASVARVYFTAHFKRVRRGWPVLCSAQSKEECDWFIDWCGGVDGAAEVADDYLAGGRGVRG